MEGGDAASNPEKHLIHFVRSVAFAEWAGNAFGALAFVWATGVLLGGFCSSLNGRDFWFATVMIFIEAFRYISSNCFCFRYTMENARHGIWKT